MAIQEPQRQGPNVLIVVIPKDFSSLTMIAERYPAKSSCDRLKNKRAHLPDDIALVAYLV